MFRNVLTGVAALLLSGAFVPQASAQSVAGAYLAARNAAVNSDYAEAARYYAEALARDPGNVELIESTVLAQLSFGDVDRAIPLARQLEEKNQNSQVARMVITADLAQRGEFPPLLDRAPDTSGIGPWVDGLVKAWAHMGAGDVTSAMAAFDGLSREAGMQGFVMYHKALALASVGDFEGAEAIFGGAQAGAIGQTRRAVMAHAEILGQLGRHDEALTVLRASFGEATDPELDRLIAALEAKEAIKFSHVRDATAGIAEVFFTFAAVLKSEAAGDYYVLLYSRIARFLRPDHIDALLLTADLLESLGQYDLAIEEYKAVPADDPAFHVAELGRAEALRLSGKEAQAVEVLEHLTRTHGDLAAVHSTLGDVLRKQEDYTRAIAAYDRAIELSSETTPARWVLFYSRGIAHERSGNEEAMEADFRAALELNPEQPQVLNYLGYSMVEQKRNLDEALEMIERAVAASPNSGYIVDSLGWVLYRLGRYEEAVVQMERAVELLAVDPVINDHLGDVYWAVGRKREAEFQWSRALSFIDEEDNDSEADPARIRRKLEVGLDKVLEEEGAPPLKIANDI
ncbi:tetratricopeptide repeat protein [Marimonas sp. MJW-29]|uniref:Tetratricopeptide repeat protein n=1 Tax=Sulfitobacter sediminis TaxID=3234186 RepID=A0ABV3RL56_9RHOB